MDQETKNKIEKNRNVSHVSEISLVIVGGEDGWKSKVLYV